MTTTPGFALDATPGRGARPDEGCLQGFRHWRDYQ